MTHRKQFVFGKGRNTGKRLENSKKSMIDRRTVRSFMKRTVKKEREKPWPTENASLKKVEKNLGYPLSKAVKKLAKNSTVVDFGCGEGQAIHELAKNNPHIKAYGFSKESYSKWIEDKHTKYIFGDANNFKRYFKENSIDFLFSHNGLLYLNKEKIYSLLPCLKVDGMMITNFPPYERGIHGTKTIEIEGKKFQIRRKKLKDTRGEYIIWHGDLIIAKRIA
jgi:SAM-dependent methyltransferase